MNKNAAAQVQEIERQATGAFGYNPLKTVKCPHCGHDGIQAIDAKAHVYTAASR